MVFKPSTSLPSFPSEREVHLRSRYVIMRIIIVIVDAIIIIVFIIM